VDGESQRQDVVRQTKRIKEPFWSCWLWVGKEERKREGGRRSADKDYNY
jgi:hypothetical protein